MKVCIRFWGRLDKYSGFHGNRKPPLNYSGENDVCTFSRLFLIAEKTTFDLGILDSGERSLPFGLLVWITHDLVGFLQNVDSSLCSKESTVLQSRL